MIEAGLEEGPLRPRLHFALVKELLCPIGVLGPGELTELVARGAAAFEDLWVDTGSLLPPALRLPPAGLSLWRSPPGDGPSLLVFGFPPARAPTEARFIAVAALGPEEGRVFLLERGVLEGLDVLIEFTQHGRAFLGPAVAADPEALAREVRRRLGAP